MPELLSTSSNFHNSDKIISSPDNSHRLVYYYLIEIAMVGPLGGECYVESKDKRKVKVHDWCGGPPAWESMGKFVTVPIWVRHADKGLVQVIGVVDVTEMELRIFSRTFSVVELRSFDGKVIYGVAGGKSEFVFDVDKEEIWETMKLVR